MEEGMSEHLEEAARAAFERGREMSLIHDAVHVEESWEETQEAVRHHWRECVRAAMKAARR